jgi:hypothetical protein
MVRNTVKFLDLRHDVSLEVSILLPEVAPPASQELSKACDNAVPDCNRVLTMGRVSQQPLPSEHHQIMEIRLLQLTLLEEKSRTPFA